MASAVVPLEHRATSFGYLTAATLIARLVATLSSALLLAYSPWLLMYLGVFTLFLNTLIITQAPQNLSQEQTTRHPVTDEMRPKYPSIERVNDETTAVLPRIENPIVCKAQYSRSRHVLQTCRDQLTALHQSLATNGRGFVAVSFALIAATAAELAKSELNLQYITTRFSVMWSSVSHPLSPKS